MKRYTILILFCFVLFLTGGTIFAQQGGFTSPVVPAPAINHVGSEGPYQNATVGQLQTLTNNKSYVVLTGNLINSVRRNYYTFRDTSGEIVIEISPYYFWGITVSPNDNVTILVEVEKKRNGRITVEAKGMRKI